MASIQIFRVSRSSPNFDQIRYTNQERDRKDMLLQTRDQALLSGIIFWSWHDDMVADSAVIPSIVHCPLFRDKRSARIQDLLLKLWNPLSWN